MKLRSRRHEPGRKRPGLAAITLSDAWRAWIVDNTLGGVDRAALIHELTAGGVPARLAAREVDAVLGSPVLAGARRQAANVERLEMVARLLRTLAEQDTSGGAIERIETLTASAMYDHYYARNRPVVLTRFLEGWPALGKWTPAHLAEHFGDVSVEVVTGRDADPECDRRFAEHRQAMTMRAYVDRVAAAGRSNDIYMIAHNRALENPALAPLLADLTPPEDMFDRGALARAASLWFGPAGTFTPLHHDTTNILFCQIYGKKRVDLISPLETALLPLADSFYSRVRVAELEPAGLGDVRVHRVELDAGEALFLPAGWWHEVTALEPSIHVSLLPFRRPNSVSWYRPGAVSAG